MGTGEREMERLSSIWCPFSIYSVEYCGLTAKHLPQFIAPPPPRHDAALLSTDEHLSPVCSLLFGTSSPLFCIWKAPPFRSMESCIRRHFNFAWFKFSYRQSACLQNASSVPPSVAPSAKSCFSLRRWRKRTARPFFCSPPLSTIPLESNQVCTPSPVLP